ncbi:MAG: hypothetical protein WB696_14815 [Chthoniobacterales bacterium]
MTYTDFRQLLANFHNELHNGGKRGVIRSEIQPSVEGYCGAVNTTVSWSFGSELTATWTWVLWTVGCGANVTVTVGA